MKKKTNGIDKKYIELAETIEASNNVPTIINDNFISIKDLYKNYNEESLQMSKVQREFSARIKDFKGFIKNILNRINYNKFFEITSVQGFYDEDNVLRILNGQHRIQWIIRFLNNEDNAFIPASLLNESYGKEKIYFKDLPNEIQEIFKNLIMKIEIYNIKNAKDEVNVFMELNCCSSQLRTQDKVFSELGYAKNINIFKHLPDFCDFSKNTNIKLRNTQEIFYFCDSGKFDILKMLKTKPLKNRTLFRFYSFMAYCLNLEVQSKTEETISNLICNCDNLGEKEVFALMNNFSYLFKIIVETKNSYLIELLNTKTNCHLVRALLKNIYSEIRNYHLGSEEKINIFTEKEIEEAFNNIDFIKKINIIHDLIVYHNFPTSTFTDYNFSNKLIEKLEK